MKLLEGKNALITGGSRGIGAAIVKKFAEQGANVAFTYVSSATKAEALRDELRALGVKAECYKSDAADFKQAGDLVYLLSAGTPSLLASQLVPAASAFDLPCFDEHLAISLYRRLYQAISQKLVRSCHDVSDGGLAVCLAESAMGGNLGLKAELNANLFAHLTPECDDATLLFGEGPGMIVASVAKENQKQFEEGFAGLAGLNLIGSVLETASGFTLKFGQSGETIRLELSSMIEAFQSALPFEEDN